jgi:hypothetical protein
MSGFFVGMIVTLRSMSIVMSVVAAMGFVEHFHFFEFVTLARNESE